MKIGILTQPLTGNYGGILQNWALQQTLKKLGHEPITIDLLPEDLSLRSYISVNIIGLLKFLILGKKYKYVNHYKRRLKNFNTFINNNINKTSVVHKYNKLLIKKYNIEGLIVGSDQVWRPIYNWGYIEDMFLDFAQNIKCIKASYAASFGTSKWEFNNTQTNKCKELIKLFNGVSVREVSGIELCNNYFSIKATQVLDPTLLISKNDYLELIKAVPRIYNERYLAAYILDINTNLKYIIHKKANELNLKPIIFTADINASYTIEEWLTIFRDADFIFTDSFHGSIFSIIFEKKFEYITNNERGETRFQVIKDLLDNGNIDDKRKISLDYLKRIYGYTQN